MNHKYAAIDIGTNSMRLLLAEVEKGKIVRRMKEINTTRIGASVDEKGMISEKGMENNLEAFQQFVRRALEYGAENIWAIATSAVRDAVNGREFVERAYKKTGVMIEIISGEEEARLGYEGVVQALGERKGTSILVIDIGGGSTELIIGGPKGLEETVSRNVGAVRMTERFITTDPIAAYEDEALYQGIDEILKDSLGKLKEKNIKQLIGIGGTITTLAAMHQQLEKYDMDKVHGYTLTLEEVCDLKWQLMGFTLEKRRRVKGLDPKRADIIIAGMTILLVIMEKLKAEKIMVSEYDNLEGLLLNKNISQYSDMDC